MTWDWWIWAGLSRERTENVSRLDLMLPDRPARRVVFHGPGKRKRKPRRRGKR